MTPIRSGWRYYFFMTGYDRYYEFVLSQYSRNFRRFAPLGIRGGRLAQLAGFGLLHRSCWHRTTGVQAPAGGGGGWELQALAGGGVGGGLHQAPAAAARSSQANLASFSPPHLSQTCSHLFFRKLVIWHLAPGTDTRQEVSCRVLVSMPTFPTTPLSIS